MRAFPTGAPAPVALPGSTDASTPLGNERNTELNALVRSVLRRKGAVLRIFFGFVALMIIGTLVWPKQYTTTIKVIAGNSNGPASAAGSTSGATDLPVLNALVIANGMQSAETYAELFKESPVVERVINDLKLNTSLRDLLSRTVVAPVTNTNILSISVTWPDAATSAKIANAFGQAIVDRQRELVSSQANAAIDSLQQQMPLAEDRMNDAQNKLTSFEAAHRIADIDTQTQNTINSMAALDAKIGQVKADESTAQAQLATVNGSLGSTPATITGNTTVSENPVVTQMQQQLTQVNVQLQQAEQQYTDQHPTVVALKQQKAQLEASIGKLKQTVVSGQSSVPNPVYQQLQGQAAQFRAQAAADAAQLGELSNQEKAMGPQLAMIPRQAADLANLKRNAKAASDVVTALQDKFVNAQVASQTALSDVTITQPASPRDAVVRPSLLINILVAIVLGAVLAVTGALLLDYFDNSIKDEREVEEELALPQVGAIPLVPIRDGKAPAPWLKAVALEAFLQMVTNMKYSTDQPLRSLAIVSPAQGDGKSTIALNSALALNELEGPVLLVDADLRRPTLHAKMRVENARGLSDVLVGQCSLDTALQVDKKTGLAVMTAGTPAPNPIKLLESQAFSKLIEELEARFKTVIFDGAALQGNLDSAMLARRVTGTVIVVSKNGTDLREAASALKRMQRMGVRNVLGFVLNRIDPRHSEYMGGYGTSPRLNADEAPILVAPR